ncbi:hypothetical protein [Gordonia paraffinivorans]|nr:hypothetical protein [Gordonia paraffinivorans]
MVLIHDETSPTTYRFAMNTPPGGHTEVNPDGSATVYDANGNPVSQVARPWAFDATGQPQKTWYTVDDNGNLVQHVEPATDARYPILADPTQTSHLIPQPGDAGFIGPVTPEQQAQARAEQAEQTPSTNEGLADLLTAPITAPPTTTGTEPSPDQGADPTPGQQLGYGDWVAHNYPGPDVGQDSPQQPQQDDNSGLSELLTAGITDQPSGPEPERSPTQGAEPAPGQQLTYNDWLANNYLGQDVGVVNVRTGTDGQPEYYRTAPDGTDIVATTAQTTPNGIIYGFEDGTILDTNVADGISSLTRIDPDGTRHTEFSNGEQLVIHPDGTGVRIAIDGTETRFAPGLDADGKPILVDRDTGLELAPTALGMLVSTTISAKGALIEAIGTNGAIPGWSVPHGSVGGQLARGAGRSLGPFGAGLGTLMDASDPNTSAGKAAAINFGSWAAGTTFTGVVTVFTTAPFAAAAILGIGVGLGVYYAAKRWG